MTELLKTIHGSRLYGLAHVNSDTDDYVVITNPRKNRKRYSKQKIANGIDTMTVDLSTFMHYCDMGVPQALEAMFSPHPDVDSIAALRDSYRVNLPQTVKTYRRKIKNFAAGDFKQRRHALRLSYNLLQMMESRRFNPTLPAHLVKKFSDMAGDERFESHLASMEEQCKNSLF